MNSKLERLKNIYANLTYDERKEVREFIKDFEDDSLEKRERKREEFKKSLGPLSSSVCPYCGK